MLAERRFQRLDTPKKWFNIYLGFGMREAREEIEIKREDVFAVA